MGPAVMMFGELRNKRVEFWKEFQGKNLQAQIKERRVCKDRQGSSWMRYSQDTECVGVGAGDSELEVSRDVVSQWIF